MKKKYHELVLVLIILFLYLGLFLSPNLIVDSGIRALLVFKSTLFPSIFPFFTLASLTLYLGFAENLSNYLDNIFKRLFHVSGLSSFIILVSIISGFPSGSFYIAKLYKDKMLDKREANYLLSFTHFANPLFILSFCASFLTKKIAYKILICQLLANIVLGIILRPTEVIVIKNKPKNYHDSLLVALPKAINGAMGLLLFMLGSITFFMFVSRLFGVYLQFNPFLTMIETGLLDLTSGLVKLRALPLDLFRKALITLSFITFGGGSIHLQVLNNISSLDLDYKYFVMGRVIETALAICLFLLFSI